MLGSHIQLSLFDFAFPHDIGDIFNCEQIKWNTAQDINECYNANSANSSK